MSHYSAIRYIHFMAQRQMAKFLYVQCNDQFAYQHTAYSIQHTVWPSVVAYLLSIDSHLDIAKREEYIVGSLKRIPTSGIRCACVRQWLVVHIFNFCQFCQFLIFVINNFEYLYRQIQIVVYGYQYSIDFVKTNIYRYMCRQK